MIEKDNPDIRKAFFFAGLGTAPVIASRMMVHSGLNKSPITINENVRKGIKLGTSAILGWMISREVSLSRRNLVRLGALLGLVIPLGLKEKEGSVEGIKNTLKKAGAWAYHNVPGAKQIAQTYLGTELKYTGDGEKRPYESLYQTPGIKSTVDAYTFKREAYTATPQEFAESDYERVKHMKPASLQYENLLNYLIARGYSDYTFRVISNYTPVSFAAFFANKEYTIEMLYNRFKSLGLTPDNFLAILQGQY